MLTNIYYYGHYRNFVARTSQTAANAYGRRTWVPTNIAPRNTGENPAVLLNKADNDKVTNFARALSSSIVGLKDASRMFVSDMNLIRGGNVYQNHLDWIKEDLEHFTQAYNNMQNLSNIGVQNTELAHFAHYFRNFARTNSHTLSHVGIISHNEASLTYHGIVNTPGKEAAKEAVNTFRTAYNITRGFLEHPLAQHMEFRDLGYYYNYTIGDSGSNTFFIIQSGMLVDLLV